MKKNAILSTIMATGLVTSLFTPTVFAAELEPGQCDMTINTEIHTWGNRAQATGPCEGLVEGYYLEDNGAPYLIGSVTLPVEYSGQTFAVGTPQHPYGESILTVTIEPTPEQPGEEEPTPEQPGEEEPTPEQPGEEEPTPEQPGEEEPTPEQPGEEEPTPEQPGEEEPAPEQPGEEEPTPEQPAEEEPASEQPAEEEPASEQPVDEEPASEQPGEEEPTPEQPGVEQTVDNNPNKTVKDQTLSVEEEKEGNKLPETATGTFNMLMIGLSLMLVGGVSYVVTRKRKEREI